MLAGAPLADWAGYLREIHDLRGEPEATAELSLRIALVNLLREIAGPAITVFPEAGTDVGQPDVIAKVGPLVVGYGETKAPGTFRQLEAVLETPQLIAYRGLPNLVLTDYLHFILLRDGVEVARATVISAADLDANRLASATPAPAEELLTVWLTAQPAQINSPNRLAIELARRARWLRDGIRAEIAVEAGIVARGGASGPLRTLQAFYRENLMSDMDADMFADTYAQTVAYGLFVGRYHTAGTPFDRRAAVEAIPVSTAFLRSSVRLLLDEDTVPGSVGWIIDDIVAVLGATSDALIARASAVGGTADDAVIYFYEQFLERYDEGERTDRGVYYTHPPLVSYAVRAVDDALADTFGVDGLADGRVRLLDPAVGTGTFLVAAAERAIDRVRDREGEAMVPALIGEHLLPHLYGFELLPAPYAIGHLKLGSYFAQKGRPLTATERVQIYLTNTLAAPLDPAVAYLPAIGALIAETRSADEVKRDTPLLVILGNPPYSVASHNKEHLTDLMADFAAVDGEALGERNIRPLDDDYLRFLRWSVWKLLEQDGAPGQGIVALVTNSAFLSRPVMRGVRHFLLDRFDEIRVLDLHGNRRDVMRGRRDDNVFPAVKVAISITLFIRHPAAAATTGGGATTAAATTDGTGAATATDAAPAAAGGRGARAPRGRVQRGLLPVRPAPATPGGNGGATENAEPTQVFYRGTRGTRAEKFAYLNDASIGDEHWTPVAPKEPNFSFLPREHDPDYASWPSLADLMPEKSPGVISHRDPLSVAFTSAELLVKVRQFADLGIPDDEVKERYDLNDNDRWNLHRRRVALGGLVDPGLSKPLTFRPFDARVIYDETNLVGDRRERLRGHLERVPGNIALVTTRSATPEAPYAFVTRAPGTQALLSSRTLGAAVYVPLFVAAATPVNEGLLPLHADEQVYELNLEAGWRARLAELYGDAFTPTNLLGYIYAVLTLVTYRERFAGALEDAFPRIPFAADPTDFELLATEGAALVRLHLLEEPGLTMPRIEGAGDLTIGEASYDEATGRVAINATQFIEPVSPEVWAVRIGGSQVLELWLRNHRGRRLSGDEARELSKIVASLAAVEAKRPDIEALVEDVLEDAIGAEATE